MARTTKQTKREAGQIFRLCVVNGALDEGRARQAVQTVLQSRQRGYLSLLEYFLRLIKLDRAQHTAKVESAEPVPDDLQANVRADLESTYGGGLATQFVVNPALIGGMRVQVGSDVYDGSVQAGIAELRKRFGITGTKGTNTQI